MCHSLVTIGQATSEIIIIIIIIIKYIYIAQIRRKKMPQMH